MRTTYELWTAGVQPRESVSIDIACLSIIRAAVLPTSPHLERQYQGSCSGRSGVLVRCQAHRESAFAISISSPIESDLYSVIQVPPVVMTHSIADIEKTCTKYFAMLMISTTSTCMAINTRLTACFPFRYYSSENAYNRLWYTGSEKLEKLVQTLRVSISHPEPCKSNQIRLGSELFAHLRLRPVQLHLSGLPSLEWTVINPGKAYPIKSDELRAVLLYLAFIRGSGFTPECGCSRLR